MAKKTKDSNLSLEEKLEQALIPNWDEPYKLPDNWCWVNLGTICSLENGVKQSGEELVYLDAKTLREINEPQFRDNGVVVVQNQKVILVDGENSGEVFIVPYRGFMGSTFRIINISKCSDEMYVRYFIDFNRDKLRKNKVGSAIPHLNKELFFSLEFPFPPLSEQQRIVARIESLFAKLDEAKEKAQEVVDGFETRKAAILHKAFSGELTAEWRRTNIADSFAYVESIDSKMRHYKKKKTKKVSNEFISSIKNYIPSEWAHVDLDRISKLITDGEHKTPRRVDQFEGYYLLSARNIHNDLLLLDDVDYVDELEFATISKRCNPKRNDLLISCSGSVGRSCVIEDNNNYAMVRSAAMVSLLEGNPRFVMYILQSYYLQGQIKKLSKQTAQANLFLGAISALIIPFPDIKEQNEIVHILDNFFKKENKSKETAESVIEQIDTMKKAILARAFRGELGTNDPTEESAVELLKQIISK